MTSALALDYVFDGTLWKRRGVESPTSSFDVLWDQDWNAVPLANPTGYVDMRAALDDATAGGVGTYNAFAIVSSGGGRAHQWHSVAGTFGNGAGNGCAVFVDEPFADYKAAHGGALILKASIEYYITFPANMDWSKGGKIPGLGGSISGNPPTGGAGPTDNGWSERSMWITPTGGTFYGITAVSPAEFIGYRYFPDQAGANGDNVWSHIALVAGNTYHVKKYHEMNSVSGGVGAHDGIDRCWINGVLAYDYSNVRYRNNNTVDINFMLWHYFRGGDTSGYAGSVNNDVITDNCLVKVYP